MDDGAGVQLTVTLPMRLVAEMLRLTKTEQQPMHTVTELLLEEALAHRKQLTG